MCYIQVRESYEHLREARESFLEAHPDLKSRTPAAAAPLRPLSADTRSLRSLSRGVSRSSFK